MGDAMVSQLEKSVARAHVDSQPRAFYVDKATTKAALGPHHNLSKAKKALAAQVRSWHNRGRRGEQPVLVERSVGFKPENLHRVPDPVGSVSLNLGDGRGR